MKAYTDIRGTSYSLAGLDRAEKDLLRRLRRFAKDHPDWNEYRNFWPARVGEFYRARGLSRPEVIKTVVYRIGQDIGSRLAIRAGLAGPPDYRDELGALVDTRFRTRREF